MRWSARTSNWVAGFGLGGFAGIIFPALPVFGALMVVAFLVPALRSRAPVAAIAGLLVGGPLLSVVFIGQAVLACSEFDAQTGQGCVGPDLTVWFVAAGFLLIAGILSTWHEARPRR